MESDESMSASPTSASESSENSGTTHPSSPISNKVLSPSNFNKDQQIEGNHNSRNTTPNSGTDIRSGSHKSRSSTPSSSENEDVLVNSRNNFDRKRSPSESSAESTVESREDGLSQNPSSSPLIKFREYSVSPEKSLGSSNISRLSNDIKSTQEADFMNQDCYKTVCYDEKEDGTININHEDLSDVSDMENEKRNENIICLTKGFDHNNVFNNNSNIQNISDSDNIIKVNEDNHSEREIVDLRQKLDAKKNQGRSFDNIVDQNESVKSTDNIDDLGKKHDEDALDFEAEEGECQEINKDIFNIGHSDSKTMMENEKNIGEELEEGEVSDEDEKRPEETEPKPVCRFYTRGACTWGMSCRFLHPGVTDKGNYTMFDMIRPVPIASSSTHPNTYSQYSEYRERSSLLHRPTALHSNYNNNIHNEHRIIAPATPVASTNIEQVPPIESAWERGLRTAKEMMRKANKRKEQDMDFEDKKMNLTLSPDDLEKDNYYIRDRASPEPNSLYASRGQSSTVYAPDGGIYSPPHRIPLRVPCVPTYDEIDPYGRSSRYRELPPHRMPQYEDERRVRPTREVIVQRIEPPGRGDEWSDPWMRSKSPGARERDKRTILRRERSYSSNSSYSSTSTSRSGSSSDSSRSLSVENRRKRYNSIHSTHKSPISRRHVKNRARSPSPSIRRRRSTSYRRSPTQKKRHTSPISPRHAMISPGSKRKRMSPIQRKLVGEKDRNKKKRGVTSSSGSGSTDSSGSETETSYTSSSSSSSRGKTPIKRNPARTSEKVLTDKKLLKKGDLAKKRSPISIELKKTSSLGASALSAAIERDNNSNSNSSSTAVSAKKITRREELLKQLRAVEDAIARKKSKLS